MPAVPTRGAIGDIKQFVKTFIYKFNNYSTIPLFIFDFENLAVPSCCIHISYKFI